MLIWAGKCSSGWAKSANLEGHLPIADARTRAETDRTEARTALDREREEINRLHTELLATRKQVEQATGRAGTLTAMNDELRNQLVQIQLTERKKTNQQ